MMMVTMAALRGFGKITLLIVLVVVFISDGQAQGKETKRKRLLIQLKGCSTRPVTLGCSDETAEEVIKLYQRGDKSVLRSLLDAGLTSDGALSATLGDFYAQLLLKRPLEFLQALTARPEKEQRKLSWLAGATDGSGMSPETRGKVQASLGKLAKQSGGKLASTARICLSEITKVNK